MFNLIQSYDITVYRHCTGYIAYTFPGNILYVTNKIIKFIHNIINIDENGMYIYMASLTSPA